MPFRSQKIIFSEKDVGGICGRTVYQIRRGSEVLCSNYNPDSVFTPKVDKEAMAILGFPPDWWIWLNPGTPDNADMDITMALKTLGLMFKHSNNWKAVAQVAVSHGDITKVPTRDLFRALRAYRSPRPPKRPHLRRRSNRPARPERVTL